MIFGTIIFTGQKLSKYEFKLSKYEFKLSKYEFKRLKYEFKLSNYKLFNESEIIQNLALFMSDFFQKLESQMRDIAYGTKQYNVVTAPEV